MQNPFGDDFPEHAPPRTVDQIAKDAGLDFDQLPGPMGERVRDRIAEEYDITRTPEEMLDAAEPERLSRLPVLLDFEGIHLAGVLDELSADPTRRQLTEAAIRDKAVLAVNTRAAARTAARESNAAGGVVTSELDIRDEAVGAAGDADVLRAFSRAFGDAAKTGDTIAGELVGLLPPRPSGPRRSYVVADGHGFDLKATASPKSEPYAKLDAIVDVIVATLMARTEHAGTAEARLSSDALRNYGAGVREGIASILEVLASPKVKTTALDSLGKRLQGMGEIDLAKRLAAAYGRKEVGEPTIKIERTPSKVVD
jgi:hypothetical protein